MYSSTTLWNSSKCVDFILFGFIILLVHVRDLNSQLTGSIQKCDNEGEDVYVPNISDNPCITCYCENREVKCRRERCPDLEGCYMVLFENLREEKKCCEMCKGCTYENKVYKSGSQWQDRDDPCVTLTCRAGVITRAVTKCFVSCSNPVRIAGHCCPACTECQLDGKKYKNGESFQLPTDLCTTCECQNGSLKCEKLACPVLNCPKSAIYQPEGECCKQCQGQRRIFNLPGGYCFFQNKIYKNAVTFKPENCTSCVCNDGTAVCEAQTCPPITCSPDEAIKREGACCHVCPDKESCEYGGKIYQDSQKWQPNVCTTCTCDDGSTRCQVQHCGNSVWCPNGYKLRYVEGECCPRCLEATGICTVFGDPHYRTFDGRIYNFQGPCKYLLAEDEVGKTFSIRVRNDARASPWFTWTRMLSIFIGGTKIGLHQKLVVKVDRKRVKLPHTNHAEFSIIREGSSVVFKAEIGVKVIWDGDSFVEVSVSSRYKRRMAGLCGNYNGFGTDDLTGRDNKLYHDGEEFGNTWRIGSKAACIIGDQVKRNGSLCDIDMIRKRRARKACSFLLGGVFSKCRRKVNVRQYYSSCITDMCDCPDKKYCACESFKAYSQICLQEGIKTRWESYVVCPTQCPERARFKRCTRRCQNTCEEPNKPIFCKEKCEPGCLCPSKRVLHNNKCILVKDCPSR